jgi:hypothetical protein
MRDRFGWLLVIAFAMVLVYLLFTVPPADPQEPPLRIEHVL